MGFWSPRAYGGYPAGRASPRMVLWSKIHLPEILAIHIRSSFSEECSVHRIGKIFAESARKLTLINNGQVVFINLGLPFRILEYTFLHCDSSQLCHLPYLFRQ